MKVLDTFQRFSRALRTFKFLQSALVLPDRVLKLTAGFLQVPLKLLTLLLKLAYGVITALAATHTFLPLVQCA